MKNWTTSHVNLFLDACLIYAVMALLVVAVLATCRAMPHDFARKDSRGHMPGSKSN